MKPPPKLERFRDFNPRSLPVPGAPPTPYMGWEGAGGGRGPELFANGSPRLASGEVRYLLAVAVDERRHRIAGDGGHRAVGAVGPTGADAG